MAAACSARPYTVSPSLKTEPDLRVELLPFSSAAADPAAAGAMETVTSDLLRRMGYEPVQPGAGAPLACRGEVRDFTFENLGQALRRSVRFKVAITRAAGGEKLYEGRGSGYSVDTYTGASEAQAAFAAAGGSRGSAAALARQASDAAWEALGALPRRSR